jgi:hypothetical protein
LDCRMGDTTATFADWFNTEKKKHGYVANILVADAVYASNQSRVMHKRRQI